MMLRPAVAWPAGAASLARRAAAVRMLKRARRWGGPLAWAVADQGVTGVTHLAVSLALARWLTATGYGAFALAYAAFLLASGVHSAVILEPLAVVGASRYAEHQWPYLRSVLWLHGAVAFGTTTLFLIVSGALSRTGHAAAASMAAAGLAAPGILSFWLFRRTCYLAGRPERAAGGSLLYAAVLSAAVLWLWRRQALTPPAALAAMGAAGVICSALSAKLPLSGRAAPARLAGAGVRRVAGAHWSYARWSLAATVAYWMANSVYVPLVGALGGLGAVAVLRAAENLTLPMNHVLTAVGLLLLPKLSEKAARSGRRSLRPVALALAGLAALAASAYGLAVALGGEALVRAFYGAGGRYAASASLVPLLAAALVARAIGDTGFGLAARAAGRPDIGFWATAGSALLTGGLGVQLVARYGAAGAAAGSMAGSAAGCLIAAALFWRKIR